MNLGKLQEMGRDGEVWCAAVMGLQTVRHDWTAEQQQQHTHILGVCEKDSREKVAGDRKSRTYSSSQRVLLTTGKGFLCILFS